MNPDRSAMMLPFHSEAWVLLLELVGLLILILKPPFNLQLLVVVTTGTLISPANALYIDSINGNQRRTFDHVEIGTAGGTMGPSPIEIVVMLLIGFLGIIVLTPIMGFPNRKRILSSSLVLASWAYWIVYGTDILPWSFVILWVYNMSNVLILLHHEALDLELGYNYFIAVFLAGGFLDGILTAVFLNVEFWKGLPHSTATCMLASRYAVKLLRWIWQEMLSEATRRRLRVRAIHIGTPPQAGHLEAALDIRDDISIEQGTRLQAIEPASIEV